MLSKPQVMGKNRVPLNNNLFHQYINTTTDYLLLADTAHGTNWQRLNLLVTEMNEWKEFRNKWNTAWQKIVSDTLRGIRNTVSISNKNKIRAGFTSWATEPMKNKLNRIASSPFVTYQDYEVFNIKLRKASSSVRPAINKSPYVGMKVMAGGWVRITCRETHDSNRSSMHPDADIIEMKYCYREVEAKAPKTIDEYTNTELSKKAVFTFTAAANKAGKRLFAVFRWRNNTNSNKSGPWTAPKTIVIGS